MSTAKKAVEVRVYHNHHPRYTLGPLGLYEVGQTVRLPNGKDVIVLNVDFDGAGVAFDRFTLGQWADEMAADKGITRTEAKERVVKEKGKARTCPHPAFYFSDPERIQAMMDHQCEVNRERLELAS